MTDGDRTRGRPLTEAGRLRRIVSGMKKTEAEIKRAEETLRQRVSFLQTLIDTIPVAIFYKDTEARYLDCNKAFEATFGRLKEDLIGKTVYDLFPEDLARIYSQADARTLREPGILRYEAPVQDTCGARREAIFQKCVFSDITGKIAGIVGTAIDITEQARTEKALREAEDKFRDVAEKSLAGIYVVQDGIFKYVNPRFAEIHGYTVEEMKERGPRSVAAPEDLPFINENLRKRLSGEAESVHFEFRIHTKDRKTRNVEVYGSRTVYEGKPAIIGTLLDITERKEAELSLRLYQEGLEKLVSERTAALEAAISRYQQTERALKESELKFRAIFEHATEGIFQTTPEGRVLSVNPAFAKMFGYESPEEVVAAVTDVGHQLYANPAHREYLRRLFEKEGRVEAFETEAYRKDGEKIWISINAHVVRDENGTVIHYEGTNQDITARKQIERNLTESEERYRTAIEHSNDAVSLISKGLHLYINQKFLEIFGYDDPGEVIGRPTTLVVHPEDKEMVIAHNLERASGNPAPSRYEFKGVKKDGSVIFIEVSVAATPYRGELVSLAYLRDVTERKKMEERLRIMSIVDELTGLYNRRGFFTLGEEQIKLAERMRKCVALFFIDLDHMKWINDTLGHQEGDRALLEVAVILRETFRETDIVGRMGGDEFAILAVDTTGEAVKGLRERLQNTVRRHNGAEARKYTLSLSVGVATHKPGFPTSLEELIIRADTLMYEEKKEKQSCR